LGFIILILLVPAFSQETNQIKLLAIGTVLPKDTPIIHWCTDEPLVIFSIIPTRLGATIYDPEESQRMIRLYFPRIFDRSTVDVLVFTAGDVVHLTTTQISKMMSGVENGVGAISDLGGASIVSHSIDSWLASGIDAIFPNDVAAVVATTYTQLTGAFPGYFLKEVPYTIVVRKEVPGNPFTPFVSVGIEQVRGGAGRNMIPKEGSVILAEAKGQYGFLRDSPPFSMSWEYGKGKTITVTEWFGHPFWSDYSGYSPPSENQFAPELFFNMVLSVTGRPLYDDILQVHRIKKNMREYRIRKGNLISVIDFATKFGANIPSLENNLDDLEEKKREADEYYLVGDYEQAARILTSAVTEMELVSQRVIELKNRALLIVYISEWLVVMGTLIISGVVVYEVMIRRRIYREVATTSRRS
jgi:hypothetical protein